MRTRIGRSNKLYWELPRSSESPQLRRYMKRTMRKSRRASEPYAIQESLAA